MSIVLELSMQSCTEKTPTHTHAVQKDVLTGGVWKVPRNRWLVDLLAKELCDPLHLHAEGVNHAHVLLGQNAHRNVLGKLLEPNRLRGKE